MTGTATKDFRLDINGLRAWAVLAVVLYHFHVPGFGGGFVGVDVFFVISGFLMTGIIVRAAERGEARGLGFLWRFYLARAWRIVPALMVLCAALLVAGWWYLSAVEYVALGEQVRSALLFFSNVKFWHETTYFNPGVHNIWLLHTWSLSVEWQFYLLLPVVLMATRALWPTRRAVAMVLALGTLLSLALNLWLSVNKPPTAFFLLPPRAWEMMAGGLAYLAATNVAPVRARWLEAFGLLLIAGAIAGFDHHAAWPGWRAMVPVAGAAAVLLASRQRSPWTGNGVMQWLGTRSYSLYLWHWPLVGALAYLEYDRSAPAVAAALLLTLVLGHVSYVLVETRLRAALSGLRGAASPAALAAGFACVLVAGAVIVRAAGVPQRLPAATNAMFLAGLDRGARPTGCHLLDTGSDAGCATGNGDKPAVVVLGDSHAGALFDGVRKALPPHAGYALDWGQAGCPTLYGVHSTTDSAFGCDAFLHKARERLRQIPADVPLLIINRTSLYLQGPNEPEDRDDAPVPTIYLNQRHATRDPGFMRELNDGFVATACSLAQTRRVYMLRPIPEMGVDVPRTLGRAMLMGVPRTLSVSLPAYRARQAAAWRMQDEAAARCGVTLLDPLPYLCKDGQCLSLTDGHPAYFDDDHLSTHGAALLAPLFAQMFRPAPARHESVGR